MRSRQQILISLGITLTLAACSDSDDESGPIALAVVAPQSGPNSLLGQEIANAVNMRLDEVGGQIAGRELEFVFVDSASDGETARVNYEAAIDDPETNVVAGFLNWHSEVSLQIMEVAADKNMAHIAALGGSSEINETFSSDLERYKVFSKGWPTAAKLVANYVTAIEEADASGSLRGENKTFYIYGEQTSWGESFGAGFKAELEENGWTSVGEVYVDQNASDFTDAVAIIRDANPRVLVGTIATAAVYDFIRNTKEAYAGETEPLIVADGLGWLSDWYSSLGDLSDGVVDQIPQFATQEAQDFAAAYRERYGSDPSPSAGGLAYDYFLVAKAVLEAADATYGSITRDSVANIHRDELLEGLIEVTDGTLMDRYVWDRASRPDPVSGADAFNFPVLQYSTGESVVVWPERLRTGDVNLE